MRIGDYRKPLEVQAKDLGYKSLDTALKHAQITAVPTGDYKDFRLEVPDGKFSIGSLRLYNTVVTLDDYKKAMNWTPVGVPLTAWEMKWLVLILRQYRGTLKDYEEEYINKANNLIHKLRQASKPDNPLKVERLDVE